MLKSVTVKLITLALTLCMLVGLVPMTAFAAGSVTNYPDFLAQLKQLEIYADEFSAETGKDSGELVLNFIRTGVERYQTGTWNALAGEEITAFTAYVEEQDAANGTSAMNLRDIVIDNFVLPNGNPADFGHMFGTMNISYVAAAIQSDDLSGWAGDVCDLIFYCVEKSLVPSGTIDEMAKHIRENCFGVNADDAFGWDDFYGDMDAYYLIGEYAAGKGKFSEIMESYYTASLDDSDRAIYFLNNRFAGEVTNEEVRTALYDAYRTNVGIQVLEADRGISDYATLRKACCYAIADYLFINADGNLNGGGSDDEEEEELPANGYYSVFSSTSSVLAPGISQDIKYAMSADGKQMVYYVATVDVTRDDVTIMANYKDNDASKGWGMQRVEDQVAAMVKNHADVENFTPVVATNGDGFNTSTGQPGGLLVMEGVEWHPVDGDGFFAILKDGSAMIGTKEDYETYKDEIQEGIGAFGATLVKDGAIVPKAGGTRASRTAIGIKADGSVVMMVLDGRQEPFSCGGTMAEIATIMYEAGCVHAVNLDGGGSTTYMSKPEGSDQIKVINRPSDGYARSVAASLVAVSTAKSSKEFDRAIIDSDYDYLTVGTSINLTAIGVNNIGSSAVIPEGAYWAVSDESIGTIDENGVFTSSALGDVTVNFIVNGEIAGSKELHVVIPDALTMKEESMNAVYGVPATLPLVTTYNGNDVAVKPEDFMIVLEHSNAGTIDGFTFTADEAAGYRYFMAGAMLLSNQQLIAAINVNLYRADEVIFDFDKATAGNSTLAWLREVTNASSKNNLNYTVEDPKKNVEFSYTFALDMSQIEIPAKLEDIVYMLPGADLENASAWGFLLDLAERVSVLTEVRITAQFDKNVALDLSEVRVINDFFELTSVTIDEDNKVTAVCNWIDQTQAIDENNVNPLCILTGIKASLKDDAEWDGNELIIANTGTVTYDIYLRASSLYSFAKLEVNQQKYGLYPYSTDKTGYEGGTESGAHFADTHADFQDSFILDKTLLQGWHNVDGVNRYYVDHVAQTGIQYIPSMNDESVYLFYNFDENGICLGTCTGTIEYNGGLYYAVLGEKTTGWLSGYDADGSLVDYYFDPATGKAVDGVQKIAGYTYTFTNNILTRGDLVTDANGTRYRWAGKWLHGQWFNVDGKWYTTKRYIPYVVTGFTNVPARGVPDWKWHLFDENGVFQADYTGIYVFEGDTYYIKNGLRDSTVGLVYEGGYYYYISGANAKAYKNTTVWVTKTNGLMPIGKHSFDENGRMIDPPYAAPEEPELPVLNGIIKGDDGILRYYINGVLQSGNGIVKLTDDKGVDFYIYVRSNGELAVGTCIITNTNGLLNQGTYTFNEEGRYYIPEEPEEPETPVVPELKNGVYSENGILRFYINGVRQSGSGVVKLIDENGFTYYIYVRSNGTVATGIYWPTVRNDLLPRGGYDWGADGRYYPAVVTPDPEEPEIPPVVDPEEPEVPDVKNGIYEENGRFYYYINGVRQSGNGVVKLTDDEGKTFYIYVRSNGTIATGVYWPTTRNDLLPRGPYDWGTDGRYYPEA